MYRSEPPSHAMMSQARGHEPSGVAFDMRQPLGRGKLTVSDMAHELRKAGRSGTGNKDVVTRKYQAMVRERESATVQRRMDAEHAAALAELEAELDEQSEPICNVSCTTNARLCDSPMFCDVHRSSQRRRCLPETCALQSSCPAAAQA